VPYFAPENVASSTIISTKARQDFSLELYNSCVKKDKSATKSFSSLHATWVSVLRAAIRYTAKGVMDNEQWIGALSVAMLSNQIECVPGTYQSRLSYRRVVKLVGYTPPALALTARPGSLKRAAIEAEDRMKQPIKRRRIDFGCAIPFTNIPKLVEDGFKQQEKNFQKGDQRVLEHYQAARICLAGCLGDPVCDVMLMLALTLASSSVTPTVAPKTRHFSVGTKKDAAMFAANLVTKMLWFLRPQAFPWKADARSVLRISEMTKKIGMSLDDI
jgi:hypothetical protein